MFLDLSGMKTSQHSIFNIPLDFQTIEMVFLSWIDRVFELATLCKESSDSMCSEWKHLSIQYATFIWICEWLGLYFSYDTTLFLIGTSLQLKAWLNVFRVETSRPSIFWTFTWICEQSGLYFSYDINVFLIGPSLRLKAWLNVFRVETSWHSIFWTFIWICEQSGLYFSHDMTIFQIETSLQGKVHLPFFSSFFRNAMYLNLFSRAGVPSGWVNHEVSLLSRFKCSNVQIFRWSNLQIFKCSNGLIGFITKSGQSQCSKVPMFQCSNLQIMKCSNVQTFKCSNVSMVQWSNVRMFRYSSDQLLWLFSRFFLQKCYVFQLVLGGRCVFRWG